MAGKGGDIGSGIGDVLSVLGNAVIPQTMANFRNSELLDNQKAQLLGQNVAKGALLGGMNKQIPARPGAFDPGMTMGPDGSPSFSPSQAPATPARPVMSQPTQQGFGNAAFPQMAEAQLMAKLFPAPLSKDDFVTGPFGAMNIRNQSVVPGTAPVIPLSDFEKSLKAAGWSPESKEYKDAVAAHITKENYYEGGDANKIAATRAQTAKDLAEARNLANPGLGTAFKKLYGSEVPPNFMPTVDQTGRLTGATKPIPGSPADPAVAEQKRVTDLANAKPKVEGALKNTEAEFDKTIGLIDEILAPNNSEGLGDVTGFGGTGIGKALTFAGGGAARVQAKINRLKGRSFLSGLAEMKAQSPTGATGLGATSEREGENVMNAQAELDQAQSDEDYAAALTKYKEALTAAKKNIRSTFEQEYTPRSMGGWSISKRN